MNLESKLSKLSEEVSIHLPPDVLGELTGARDRVVASGSDKDALDVGDKGPLFNLPNAHGKNIALEDLLAQGPVVLNFYRGGWCDYCNLELRALQDALERSQKELSDLNASVVAISPQTQAQSLATAEKNDLTYNVLSDAGNNVARSYGLVFKLDDQAQMIQTQVGAALPDFNGDDSWDLPHPGTFVISRTGFITWRFVNADFTKRSEPDDVFEILMGMNHGHD